EDSARAFRGNLFHVRIAAARALGDIGPDARAAAPVLLAGLRDPDFSLRGTAAAALGAVGADPRKATPALAGALRDKPPFIQEAAARSLGRMGPTARAAVPCLAALLKQPGGADYLESLRVAAAVALWEITGDTAQTVPALVEALKPTAVFGHGPAS